MKRVRAGAGLRSVFHCMGSVLPWLGFIDN